MSKKQITDLANADSFDDGDLMLVRKSGAGVDRKLTKDKLVDSLGASAVAGYQAGSTEANKINLVASNGFIIKEYKNGMHICFITPVATSGVAEIKINSLPYINLEKYNSTDTAELEKDEYVEAVYTAGAFKQTNKLNTNLVWSNEYTAIAEITGTGQKTTNYKLSSAIGVTKPNYYDGMVAMFVVPEDSQGIVFINVDGLGDTPIGDGEVSFLNNNDFYKNRLMQLVYKNGQFLKYTMPTQEQNIPVVTEVDIEPPPSPANPQDVWNQDYAGSPNDPANTTDYNALDNAGRAMYAEVIFVGPTGNIHTLSETFAYIFRTYSYTGKGRRVAIVLKDNYVLQEKFIYINGGNDRADLRWITIFSEGNGYVNFNTGTWSCTCEYTPIFNLKMQVNRSDSYYYGASWLFYLANPTSAIYGTTLTFGKETDIIFNNTNKYANSNLAWGIGNVVALYGMKLHTTNSFFSGNMVLNRCHFTYNPLQNSPQSLMLFSTDTKSEIYNSEFNCVTDVADKNLLTLLGNASVLLQNVSSGDRKNQTNAIRVTEYSRAKLVNCRFGSNTTGGINSGHDIVVNGNRDSRIYLTNTTGNTNQPIGTETTKGNIIQN